MELVKIGTILYMIVMAFYTIYVMVMKYYILNKYFIKKKKKYSSVF